MSPTVPLLSAEYAMIPRMPLSTGPLIGRDTDLSRLADAIGLRPTPGARPGGVVVLSGDAGIGKSRIVGHLVDEATAADWFTPVGHCVGQAGSSLAYLPFVELVGTIDAGHPDVVERVLDTHPSLGHLLPGRADAPDGDRSGRSTDPGQVAEAVHALLSALGDTQPSLLVIEDVHWADHSSRDLITLLLTRGFTRAVGLVVTYRSDDLYRRHPLHETLAVWARIAGLEHVDLAPLPDDAVRELVSGIEGAPTDAATNAEIARRSEGNPFFAEELVASAAAGQALTGGLSRVLRARVEQLDETAQRVLRAIALKGGQYIGHDLLSRVVDLPDETLEAALAAAVEHHVLEARWPPAYTFRHALLGETVADSLLPGERLRLHRAYAAVLAERPELAPASELARHAAAVGDLPTAVRASRAAAESAMAVGGPQEALLHLERALTWLDEDDPERDEVTLRASRAAMVAGEPIRAMDLLRDRLDHPGTAQEPGARADLLSTLVIRSRILDLPIDSIALTDEALSLIGEEADERRVRVLVARVQALVDHGSFVEAAVVGNEVSLLAERLGLGGALAEVRTIMARILEAQEDLDSVETHLRSIVADIDPDDPLLLRALHQLASLAHRRGDLPGSLALYDRGADVARRMHREWAPWGQECRLLGGLTAYELGDWDGAARRLDLGGRPAPQPGRTIFTGAALLVRAGRGDPVDPDLFDALREWWPVDGLCVVLTTMPAVDVLGQAGDLGGMLDLTEEAVRVLDATWGEYHAVVRLAALVAGQAASLVPRADSDLRARAVAVVDDLAERGRRISELRPAVEKASRPKFERAAAESLEDTSRETWAWTARLEAEVLRLRRVAGVEEPPPVAELVDAWRESVAAFERYGHVFEAARSRARLSEALRAAGDDAGSRTVAEQAREVAVRLEAKPLLAELDAVRPGGATVELTPRELEVLALLAQGLTNGQIGKQLYISTKTVSVHVSNLLAKLGASGRTEAAAIARRRGLVTG
ncbi:LuxR C-terminal-related transcriptional regulator [Terrabacter sp. LjRoot27]|uniref:helix-turn-helix transcriptional regulator n=1 Tax=Terrabacter sp. LjRoot27 TaxID=3342306 RepID=UPI003ECE0364